MTPPAFTAQCPGRFFLSADDLPGLQAHLADGPCLVHGDFFPGSLVRTARGVFVIDPEIAHFGHPEFDLGVWLGHLLLAGQPAADRQRFLQEYDPGASWSLSRVRQLAGMEVLRRILGYAQLPLRAGLAARSDLLALARELVLFPDRPAALAACPAP